MSEKISVFDFTEEVYLALKDLFIAKVVCGVTEIDVTFSNGQHFKLTIEEE